MEKHNFDLSRLTVAEKLELLREIRLSLYRAPGAFPLTEDQRQALDHRLDELALGTEDDDTVVALPQGRFPQRQR